MRRPIAAALGGLLSYGLATNAALADDVRSVIFVAKSENKNEVHYGIAVDAECKPSGPHPVYAYWRMRERGPDAVASLLASEQRAYGIALQNVKGGSVEVSLHALPSRSLLFETMRDGRGGCAARVVTQIHGERARLHSVYVKLGFPFRVEYLLLQGHALEGGRWIRERL